MKVNQLFTQAQINWAMQHDWFVGGDEIIVIAESNGELFYFESFQALRDWAGY